MVVSQVDVFLMMKVNRCHNGEVTGEGSRSNSWSYFNSVRVNKIFQVLWPLKLLS